jgi:hypothetical protein
MMATVHYPKASPDLTIMQALCQENCLLKDEVHFDAVKQVFLSLFILFRPATVSYSSPELCNNLDKAAHISC